ncbi:leucine carboxyl methyltransferase, putative [Bodo saltans]|uniref:Leucine carboxyl methyltransferase 1 n=1 Tax=Bodo saltans TaxID=75058 RepID=A0A0S4JL13_BODSA|nr:leucine carboxyl methyltransferase, putative [Bodo saltans]|eukprot:CUG91280.1 leucine carboxyl methyltransferase, putative [Bodo saltans]
MALQQTAHDACSRRVHCVSKGYLDDPFVRLFARDLTIVNSPLMNRGSWLRSMAFENMVYRFSQVHGGAPIQVVSLGAGVDTLFFRLRQRGSISFSKFVEIDLPDLIEEKRGIIHRNHELSSLVADDVYHAVPGDLADANSIASLLQTLTDPSAPTLLIAECVFVYIPAPAVLALLTALTQLFVGDLMLVNYDVIEPNDRFGSMMIENLKERGIHLAGITGAPTIVSHAERAKGLGFTSVRAVTMKGLYLTVPRDTQVTLNKLEMIDDWDEWNLVHEHYAFVIAWRGGDGTSASIPQVFIAPPPS